MIALHTTSPIARRRVPIRALILSMVLSGGAHAQVEPAEAPGPSQTAAVPADAVPPYRSTLDNYRRYRIDERPTDWRSANEIAERLRGHGGQLAPSAPVDAPEAKP